MRNVVVAAVLTALPSLVGCAVDGVVDDEGPPSGSPAPQTRLLHPLEPGVVRFTPPPSDTTPPTDTPPTDTPPPNAGCERVRVVNTAGQTLNVRPDPSTSQAPVGTLSAGQIVDNVETVTGEDVGGDTTWYHVQAGVDGFVSGAYADCVDDSAPPPPAVDGFMLPLSCGTTVTITQGNNGPYSHTGMAAYAFDFGIPRHTPLVAIESGTVIAASDQVQPGDNCWEGGGQECANTVNYVVLQHDDGTASIYLHLDAPAVDIGDVVARGQQVAWSGGTGWSTGPHAHMQRQEVCGSWWCQSVATSFADVGGVPQTGDAVTSGNCP